MKIKTAIVSILFVPFLVFAQNGTVLPNAGLTPESPFYFIDKLGEALRGFFTFNPEGKARLQITFAAERVAEMKVILETKGVEAKGLEVAQARLQTHLGDAAEIVVKQRNKGKDVRELVKELNDEFEKPKSALAQSFKEQKRVLETEKDELKVQLKAAHRAGDTAKAEAIAQELGQVKAQKELLELKEEEIEDELEAEEEKLEEEIEAQHKAEKAIREAEEEKEDSIDEAAKEGIELPADVFVEFDSLLSEAKRNLEEGDFIKAKHFAKQAEKSFDKLEKTIEELEKKQKKKEEAEEAIKKAKEEKQEVSNEASKEGTEVLSTAFTKFDQLLAQANELFAKENYHGAKQFAEQAEDTLKDVDKEIEKLEKEKKRQKGQIKDEKEQKREQEEKQQEVKDQNNEKEEGAKQLINEIWGSKSVKEVKEEPQQGYWQDWPDYYKPVGNIPPCPEPIIIPLPIDHTKITSILYPGQYRGQDYKAHGGFRLDNLPDTKATVRIPLDAELIYGSRHTQSGEIQYLLGFRMPCGIEYRLDHLRVLESKFQKLIDAKLPVPKVEDSRTTNFNPPIPVKAGEIIAIEVGFSNPLNVGFDFGVYDLRKKNKKSAYPEWIKARGGHVLSHYAVCWFEWLSPEDEKFIRSLPAADWASGSKSDFCE